MKSVFKKHGVLKLIGTILDIIAVILLVVAVPVTNTTVESALRLAGIIMLIIGTFGIFHNTIKEKLTKLGFVGSILIVLSFILLAVSVFLDESSNADLVNPDMVLKVASLIIFIIGGFFMSLTSKEHNLMKSLLVIVIALVLFSWFIPYGYFNSGDFYEYGLLPIGIVDFSQAIYNALTYSADKVVFLIVLAGFYGVLSKISGYQKLVSTLADKCSKKPILTSVIMSVILFVLTSLLTQTLIVLIFVPLCISILLNMKIDKLTAFAITFGSVLVGVLGATYGTEGITMFNNYMSMYGGNVSISTGLTYRFIIAAVALVLYNFFICMRLKKVLAETKKNAKNADVEDDPFKIEVPKKKCSVIPVVVVLFIVAVLAILTHTDWNGNFGLEIFNEFHTWLTELAPVEDFTIMSYILGLNTAQAFGEYTYVFVLVSTLVIAAGLIAYLYQMKFNEFIDAFYNGTKKMFKPILCGVAVYLTFALCYNSPFIATIANWLLNLVEGFNPYLNSLMALITAVLNNDLGYTSYTMSPFLVYVYNNNLELVHVIYTSITSVAQIILPTSFTMVIGLKLMKLDYKAWFKYIWLFVVGMIVILLVLFTVVTYV